MVSAGHALGIERTADDVVTHAGQVLDTAAADQNDGVLLQVVADAGDISGNFISVGEAHTGDLSQRGVRLLRGRGSDGGANASLLRGGQVGGLVLQRVEALLQRGSRGLEDGLLSALSDQLIKSRQRFLLS